MVQNYNAEPIVTTLENGGLILYPTDTIWAIGCDATNEQAVERVIALKQWDYSAPLVLLASSIEMVKHYVKRVHPRVETLLAFHTRPLSIVYDKGINLPKNVLGSDGSVAFRIPRTPFARPSLKAWTNPSSLPPPA
jgi:L-threonylcarbamoyladenylate synthase